MKTVLLTSLLLTIPSFIFWTVRNPLSKVVAAEPPQVVQIRASEIGEGTIILGYLRHPIGEELTIHGRKITNGPLDKEFLVDAVNNQQLEPRTTVSIEGIQRWSDGTEATIRGYEEGQIHYLHMEETNFGPHDPRFKPHQEIFLTFKPIKLLEPKELKLAPGR